MLQRRWTFEAGYAALLVLAVVLILSLVGRHSGWPIGQAFTEELILVQLYAAHFHHLDFFPVWSSSDGLGLGSPVLLYYQKSFFYIAAGIETIFGVALKPALVMSMAFFLAIGAYGMRQTLGLFTRSRFLRTVGSLGFLFTNYVYFDWITRGDLPEFSAVMVVPWFLYCCLNLVKNQKVSLIFIPAVFFLVQAHSAIALISVFTLVVTAVTFVVCAGRNGISAVYRRLIVVFGASALLLAPTLIAELQMSQDYDPASKVTHGGSIANDFISFGSYFYDGGFRWLTTLTSFVQIDFAIWIPVALAIVGWTGYTAVRRLRPELPHHTLSQYVETPAFGPPPV